jgi:hypothetical protein
MVDRCGELRLVQEPITIRPPRHRRRAASGQPFA